MKCRFVLFLTLLFLISPLNVMAEELVPEIDKVWITGMDKKTVGEELSLSFGVSVSGIQKGNADSLGIMAVSYVLDFDDTVFTVVSVTSHDFDTVIYKEDGVYYVLSTVGEKDPFKNKCVDGVSFCAQYMITVNFFVNDTDRATTDIKMEAVTVGLMEMIDPNKEYTEDDVKMLIDETGDSYTITIKQPEEEKEIVKKPSSIVSDKKPNTSTEDLIEKKQQTVSAKKSDNNYIKKLEIDGYEIEFDKNKKDYEIEIEEDVNKLKLDITLDDSKATYKIIGADKLAENDYKVSILVTAQNGDENTYTVKAKIKEEKDVVADSEIEDEKLDEKQDKKFVINKKYLIIGGICLGVLLLIIIIIKIVSHRSDRKLEKDLDLL